MPVTLTLNPGTTDAQRTAVETYLTTRGFQVTGRLIKNSGLQLSGTTQVVESTFGVRLFDYQGKSRTFFANDTAIRIPKAIGATVASVIGLNNASQLKAHAQPVVHFSSKTAPPVIAKALTVAPAAPPAATPSTPVGASAAGATTPVQPHNAVGPGGMLTPPYTAAQLRTWYHLDALSSAGYDGGGQTIGIITFGSFNMSDVREFQASLGIAQASIEVHVMSGATPSTDPIDTMEATLDVSWASAMAPGAHIVVLEADQQKLPSHLIGAFSDMLGTYQPNLISLSYGACEAELSGGEQAGLQAVFQAAGVTIPMLVASGDFGSRSCVDPNTISAEWPATDPYVTAVGGTSLAPDSAGNPSTETAWSCGPDAATCSGNGYVASGGGYSNFFSRPSWQTGSNPFRGVPDVALAADPTYGYAIYKDGLWLGGGSSIGGTSAAAPAMAGMLATIAQARGGALSSLNSALYSHSSAFTDIRPTTAVWNGDYHTATGWDPVTGLGSPRAERLLQALGGPILTQPTPTVLAQGIYGASEFGVTKTVPGDWSYCSLDSNGLSAFGQGLTATTCSNDLSGGGTIVSNVEGDTLSLTFTGTRLTLVYSTAPDAGQVGLSIDGHAPVSNGVNKPILDQYSATAADQVAMTFGPLTSGTHTFTLTVLSSANASSHAPPNPFVSSHAVFVDALIVDPVTISGKALRNGTAANGVNVDVEVLGKPLAWFSSCGLNSAGIGGSGNCHAVTSDSTGAYSLVASPGGTVLWVDKVGGNGANSSQLTFVNATGGTTFSGRDVAFQTASTTLSGAVSGTSGPAANATVKAQLSSPLVPRTVVPIASTTTDASGNYSLSLAPGTYTLQINASGYGPEVTQATLSGTTTTLNIVLAVPPVTVSGQVTTLDPNGSGTFIPLAGAVLTGSYLPVSSTCAGVAACLPYFDSVTDTNGNFTMHGQPGKYELFLSANDQPAGATNQVNSLSVTPYDTQVDGTTKGGLVLKTYPSTSQLTGYVTDRATGRGLPGVTVELAIPSIIDPGNGEIVASTISEASSGLYILNVADTANVAGAVYKAVFRGQGYGTAVVDNLAVTGATTVLASSMDGSSTSRNVPLKTLPVTISGRVLNGSTPVPNAPIQVNCQTASGTSCAFSVGNNGFSAGDGSYTVSGVAAKYELYVPITDPSQTFASPALKTVDASSGTSFTSRDITVATLSARLSGQVKGSLVTTGVDGAYIALGLKSSFSGQFDILTVVRSTSDTNSNHGVYSVQLPPGSFAVLASQAPQVNSTSLRDVALTLSQLSVTGTSVKTAGQNGCFSGIASGTTDCQNLTFRQWPVTITGQVLKGAGIPLAGAALTAQVASNDSTVCGSPIPPTNFGFEGPTDANGNYVLHGPPGKYEVYLASGTAGGGLSVSPTIIDATSGTTFSGQNVTVAGNPNILTGTVTNAATGAPLAGATVTLLDSSTVSSGKYDVVGYATTNSAGRYALPNAPRSYSFVVSASGFVASTAASIDTSSTVVKDATLSPSSSTALPQPVTITGRVMNGTTAVGGAKVSAAVLSAGAVYLLSVTADSNGAYSLKGPQGKYDLFVASGFPVSLTNPSPNSTQTTSVDASSGTSFTQRNILVASPTLGSGNQPLGLIGQVVTGPLKDPVAGALVDLAIPSTIVPGAFYVIAATATSATGTYQLPVAPGTYAAGAGATGFAALAPTSTTIDAAGASYVFTLDAAIPPANPAPLCVVTTQTQNPVDTGVGTGASSTPPAGPGVGGGDVPNGAIALTAGGFLLPNGQLVASLLNGGSPVSLSATLSATAGGDIVAGNLGISIPPAALAGAQGDVTVSVTAHPANVPVPGGPMQYSPNGTIADISLIDSTGTRITTFNAPVTLVFRYNAADLGQAGGNASVLTAAYVIDDHSPEIENPLHFPIGTFVLFAPSVTTRDATAGTVTVQTQALGSVVSVVTNPVGYVQTVASDTQVLSSFASDAQSFGTKPQFSYMQVVEPQIGNRLLVLDPDSGNYAYVNASDVGPSGPPPAKASSAVVRGLLGPGF